MAHNNHMEQPNHERQKHNSGCKKPSASPAKGLPFKERFRNTPVCVLCFSETKTKNARQCSMNMHDALFQFLIQGQVGIYVWQPLQRGLFLLCCREGTPNCLTWTLKFDLSVLLALGGIQG